MYNLPSELGIKSVLHVCWAVCCESVYEQGKVRYTHIDKQTVRSYVSNIYGQT